MIKRVHVERRACVQIIKYCLMGFNGGALYIMTELKIFPTRRNKPNIGNIAVFKARNEYDDGNYLELISTLINFNSYESVKPA